mgnify:CR=1 FL=1
MTKKRIATKITERITELGTNRHAWCKENNIRRATLDVIVNEGNYTIDTLNGILVKLGLDIVVEKIKI